MAIPTSEFAHDVRVVVKLDSRVAVVWRDPFSLQFGVDPVRTVLREVSNAEERMIAAMTLGVSRSGLDMIAASSGVGQREVTSLLKRLDAVLVSAEEAPPARRVAIVGRGPTADRIADALAIAGVEVVVSETVPEEPCDLGLAIGHYVLDPQAYGHWLRRDLPHLTVVFGDESVTIGPLVEPGVTACLYCLEHYRRDGDASWAAIASQLWGRTSESETPLASIEVASRVARLILRRLDGAIATSATSQRIDVQTGEIVNRVWMPHPDCGCIDMASDAGRPAEAGAASAGPKGIGSARDSGRPTRVAVFASPA